ncbi:MAG: TonB-dependent receptor [Prevotella sp.]|nr:TonB-dependent receptor [Prevotella sp.]
MKKRLTMFFACLFLCVGSALAQTKVAGTVLSQDDGQPIIGAAVKVDGTSTGMLTDVNGRFSLTLPEGKNTITISYLGYISQTLKAKNGMRVFLKSDAAALDEVIVVAYGTQKKSAFTGSAAQVDSKAIEAHVSSNVANALAGAAPGVQIINTSGDPASSSPTIRVRGIGSMSAGNNPLIVLDGMPFDGALNSINPNDVESMTVLKDASASAIYGARGANGVVLITTKKGRNQEAEIKFDAKWGSNSRLIPQYDVIDDPGQYYETLFKQLYNSQIYNGKTADEAYAFANKNIYDANNGGTGYQIFTVPEGQNLIGTNLRLNPNAKLGYSDGEYYYYPDDWYDEAFHNSFRQEYNVSFSGVTDKLNYYASAGYLKDGGVVNNSDMQRYTARLNVDYQVKKWLKIGTNMAFSHRDANQPSYSTSWGSSGNIFYICNMIAPIYPLYVRDAQGNIMTEAGRTVYDANQTNFRRANFVGNAVRDNEVNRTKTYLDNFDGKFSAVLTPIEGLTLSANLAVSARNARENDLSSTFGSAAAQDGVAYVEQTRFFNVTNQYLAEYRTDFAENTHHLDVLAGYEQYKHTYQLMWGQNDHLFNPYIGELGNAAGSDNKQMDSFTQTYMTEGILSRVQYDYLEKYFVSASYRRDASSRFAPDHRWGNFFSVGLAWEIAKESFLKNVKWIDMLKLKASYGEQGNDAIGTDAGYAATSSSEGWFTPYADQYNATYANGYSLILKYKGNENLTWEKSKAYNIGVDFSLFKGRLTGTLEYFNRKTSDLLYYKPVPLSAGNPTGEYPTNVGKVTNRGVEFNVIGTILRTNDITWTANLNLTHYKNVVDELDESVRENGIKYSTSIITEGGSLYDAYMFRYAGVDKETGEALYYYKEKDENGNETGKDLTTANFSQADKYNCGSVLPKLYGGFGTTLYAYGFDLSAQFQFQLGGKIYDGSYQALMHTQSSAGQVWHKDALKAWTPENPNTDVPRLDGDTQVGQSAVDRFQISSNYLSLNNATLGYTFPKKLIAPLTLTSLRIYVAGENLFVWSKRKGLDPRYSLGIGGYTSGSGLNTNGYSAMRTITAGLTVTF